MAEITDLVELEFEDTRGTKTVVAMSYDIQMGIMVQPSRFALRFGHSGLVKELLDKYPPNTKCRVYVKNEDAKLRALQFSGIIEAQNAQGPNATVSFRGRDGLAQLLSAYADKDTSFQNITYLELVEKVLAAAGIPDAKLVEDMVDDLIAKTGSTKIPLAARTEVVGFKTRVRRVVYHPPMIKAGQRWYEFLKRILDRAGMFLIATADGGFVLMQPNPKLSPLYRIVNRRRESAGDVDYDPGTVINFDFNNDCTERFTDVSIFGRGHGKNFSRPTATGVFSDEEMKKYGFARVRGFSDVNVGNDVEAEFFARRKVADSRRTGRFLSYTLAGHTTRDRNNKLVVWARGTMVDVVDEELGIGTVDSPEPHYIDHVTFWGDERETHTILHLMRPQDLVFGDEEE